MNTLRIACRGAGVLNYRSLKDFQGNLKNLLIENYDKLRAHLESGYAFPVIVWVSPDGDNFIIDGHQRVKVIRKMAAEGWVIPPLPVSFIEADTFEEATDRLMSGASQFGTVTDDGLYEFMNTRNIEIDTIIASTHFHEIDMSRFVASYYGGEETKEPEEKPKKSRVCPHCGEEL
jgi:hypothetical protein